MEIIDIEQLSECLTGEIDLDLDLMRCAIGELKEHAAAMQTCIMPEDEAAWTYHAHRSFGASASLGFKRLAHQFREAEFLQHGTTDPSALLERINETIGLTEHELSLMKLL